MGASFIIENNNTCSLNVCQLCRDKSVRDDFRVLLFIYHNII